MQFTRDDLTRFADGELEVHEIEVETLRRFTSRGPIATIEINEGGELVVTFIWVAQRPYFSSEPWTARENFTYRVLMSYFSFEDFEEGRVMISCPMMGGEFALLIPNNGSFLDPKIVHGLKTN